MWSAFGTKCWCFINLCRIGLKWVLFLQTDRCPGLPLALVEATPLSHWDPLSQSPKWGVGHARGWLLNPRIKFFNSVQIPLLGKVLQAYISASGLRIQTGNGGYMIYGLCHLMGINWLEGKQTREIDTWRKASGCRANVSTENSCWWMVVLIAIHFGGLTEAIGH